MQTHRSSSSDLAGGGGWEQQLQAAERQYSNFFPDLELPAEPQGQGQGPPPPRQQDHSTLLCEHAFLAAVAGLGVAPLTPAQLGASGLSVLDDSRRYSHASIGQMELREELDAELQGMVTKMCR